jgi:uncharacterized protein
MDLRRHLTRRNLLIGLGAGAVVSAVDAFAIEPAWLEVTRHQLALADLPEVLVGFSIAQITDAHLTRIGRVEHALLAAIRDAAPQVVALTGDLVDNDHDLGVLTELCAALTELGVRTVACLGNWEHWGEVSLDRLRSSYASAGATLLVDEWWDFDSGLAIYASDDSTGGRPRVCPRAPRAPVELLLTHSPAFVDESAARGFDLCLAGHTHGGQIRVGSLAPFTPPGSGRFVAGWYESDMGPLYVSRGTGTSLVPARFLCRPELAIITLARA